MQQYFVNFDLEIQDFGCGIPPDRIENLFINFSKIEENQKRNKFGVGLGLSICKSLIEQMAGSVVCQSEVGKGTKFIITFKTVCQLENKQEFINPIRKNTVLSNITYGEEISRNHA